MWHAADKNSSTWVLFSSFLNASVRRAPAAALCTFISEYSSSSTRGGIPPSILTCTVNCVMEDRMKNKTQEQVRKQANLTLVLMQPFSWERLVIASAALLITPLTARVLQPFLCLFNKSTRWGRAPASTMSCWCSGCSRQIKAEKLQQWVKAWLLKSNRKTTVHKETTKSKLIAWSCLIIMCSYSNHRTENKKKKIFPS